MKTMNLPNVDRTDETPEYVEGYQADSIGVSHMTKAKRPTKKKAKKKAPSFDPTGTWMQAREGAKKHLIDVGPHLHEARDLYVICGDQNHAGAVEAAMLILSHLAHDTEVRLGVIRARLEQIKKTKKKTK